VGSTSKYGRATINPTAPSAVGTCDRCGFLYNLHVLRWQFQWAGTGMINKQLRVCPTCYDRPSEFLRTIILPADPPPVNQPRPEPYLVDEVNEYWLRAAGLGVPMFGAAGDIQAVFSISLGMSLALDGVSDIAGTFMLGRGLSAALDGASDLAATTLLGIGLSAALDGVSDVAATLTQETPSTPVSREATDSFSFLDSGTFTETGASIGTAVAGRLVFVAISGINSVSLDGIDSMTIGGVAATMVSGVVRAGTLAAGVFSEIWYAAVPTGTTANIVLTFTGDDVAASAAVYKVLNADAVTPIASQNTGSVASGNVSAAVTIGDNTAVITTAECGIDASDVNITWTNATEDFDLAIDLGGAFVNSGFASRADAVGPGATTITASPADADQDTNKTLAVVVIDPA
jgi:hypothetical protein